MRAKARALGFDVCRITSVAPAPQARERLSAWIAAGAHGDMDWMARTLDRRVDPRELMAGARSLILLGFNYGPANNPLAGLERPETGVISVYARNRDYHDVLKGKLKELAGFLAANAKPDPPDVRVFVDTAPLMEKPLAARAGVGWQGKHTNLVSRDYGSWLFLGAILTDLDLPPDEPETDHCGTCSKCLDICPTGAFPAPYKLDARRCVSYLTIEHRGPIPRALRPHIGNRIYGCDDCLAVCPWNKFASLGRETKLFARADLESPALETLAELDDAGFRGMFAGSPIKRIGRERFLRNVMIAIGNSKRPAMAKTAMARIDDALPLVRGAAIWALARLLSREDFAALERERAPSNRDPETADEWSSGLGVL